MLALEREVMTRADAVRSISAAIRASIEQAYGFTFDPDRVLVAPLGVRAPHTVTAARSPGVEILFVGRLEARKGIDVLLDTVPRLLQSHPDARVTIAGDNGLPAPGGGTYMERFLEAHAGAAWLSRVRFLGRVPEEIIQDLYASCDIFVAPSRFESFGLVYLEAMRVGKPVIGCRAGGVPEIVTHEENGLLVPPGDPAALVEALDRLLSDADERARLGEAGRRTVAASFTAADMAQRSLQLYAIAMRRRPPAA